MLCPFSIMHTLIICQQAENMNRSSIIFSHGFINHRDQMTDNMSRSPCVFSHMHNMSLSIIEIKWQTIWVDQLVFSLIYITWVYQS
jgi:hypothetical protein